MQNIVFYGHCSLLISPLVSLVGPGPPEESPAAQTNPGSVVEMLPSWVQANLARKFSVVVTAGLTVNDQMFHVI